MMNHAAFGWGLAVLLIGSTASGRAEEPGSRQHVQAVVAEVDRLLEQNWKANGITPAGAASPSEFLRRVWLDVAGKIPQVSVTREFLAGTFQSDDGGAQLRLQMIDRLLNRPTYVTHFAEFWQAALIPEATADPQLRQLRPAFEAWLRDQLREEVPYDQVVRSIITAPIDDIDGNPRRQQASPGIFFRVKQLDPASVAAATSRAFLGVRLECAQCHDHPFDAWKREQFWGLAAFYAGVRGNGPFDAIRESPEIRQIRIPDSDRFVAATFLTDAVVDQSDRSESGLAGRRTPREELAAWITAPENPWFARMAVNRLWSLFFGRGFVDPVDDFGDSNPPVHSDVLDLLAREFVACHYDLKFLIRVIISTRAYQLSSRQASSESEQTPPEMFARSHVRGLTPRQIFNSLSVALGTFDPFTVPGQFIEQPAEREFLDLFGNEAEGALERSTTILQALSLMNGDLIGQGTDTRQGRILSAISSYPFMNRDQKIETLYLAALVRRPTADERKRLRAYVDSFPAEQEPRALSDIYWSLLNSSEFLFNH